MNNLTLIPESNVVLVFAVFFGIVLLASYLLMCKKSKSGITVGVIIIIVVSFCVHKFMPWVYIVTECGKVEAGLLPYPQQTDGKVRLDYGTHCYILNQSWDSLYISTIYYGNSSPEKNKNKIVNPVVQPQSVKKVEIIQIEHFFEDISHEVKTRQDGYIQYQVNCLK